MVRAIERRVSRSLSAEQYYSLSGQVAMTMKPTTKPPDDEAACRRAAEGKPKSTAYMKLVGQRSGALGRRVAQVRPHCGMACARSRLGLHSIKASAWPATAAFCGTDRCVRANSHRDCHLSARYRQTMFFGRQSVWASPFKQDVDVLPPRPARQEIPGALGSLGVYCFNVVR